MICDDMEEIRDYYKWIIDSQEEMSVVACAASGKEACVLAEETKPDIVLMDIQMDEANDGIGATERIVQALPDVKVIVLTIHNDDELLIDAYTAGAVDYIIKDTDSSVVLKTIRSAYANKYFVGTTIAKKVKESFNREREYEKSLMYFINNMSQLTNAEWKILRLLYSGKKRKEISRDEVLSEETVKFHIRNILKKMGFSSTADMISYLKKIGIIEKFNL